MNNYSKTDEEFVIASLQSEENITAVLGEAIETLPITFNIIRNATSRCPVLQDVKKLYEEGWPR